jgi:hypothetical protein
MVTVTVDEPDVVTVQSAAFAGNSSMVNLTARVVAIRKTATNRRQVIDAPLATD